MNPLVSIIIPTYSRPENLCRAIDSVLNQTYSPIEIIVVDDNGEGTEFQLETERILQTYLKDNKITYLKHSVNKNGSAARNTGSRASHGDYIGYLDDDDVFLPTKIEKQVARIQEAYAMNPKMQASYCNIEMEGYKKDGFKLMSCLEGNLSDPLLLSEIRFNSSTILMMRSAYEAINGWDERYARHQDWEFCIRYFSKFEMVNADKDCCLVKKYKTPNFNTANPDKVAWNLEFFLNEMKPYIDSMERKNEIYAAKYSGLMHQYLAKRNFKKAVEYLKLVEHYSSLGIADYLKMLGSIIKSFK